MKILFAASECAPFIKTGGLADVVGALPKALVQKGVDARVILPKYSAIPEQYRAGMKRVAEGALLFGIETVPYAIDSYELSGVTFYFVDCPDYFDVHAIYGDGLAEGFRFAFFSRAVIECLEEIGFVPDILHLNDWQTGLVPALLKTQYQQDTKRRQIRTVYSIHNLRYQGIFDWDRLNTRLGLDGHLFTPDYIEFYGMLSCMKAGIVFADRISTVSPNYAEEIRTPYYGEQLDGVLNRRADVLSGILNGIDTESYDPANDPAIAKHFDVRRRRKKADCKKALQNEMHLPERPEVPVISMITRLTSQKGLDLLECVLEDMLRMDIQMVFLGSGEQHYVDIIEEARRKHPDRVACYIGFNEPLSRRIYAGSDLFLMPSQFEPCGLSQLISLRYGTIPIVRETGGLKDSIHAYNQYTDEGNGFSFANYNAHEMLYCTEQAVKWFYDDKPMWDRLTVRALKCDFGWSASADKYIDLYRGLIGR